MRKPDSNVRSTANAQSPRKLPVRRTNSLREEKRGGGVGALLPCSLTGKRRVRYCIKARRRNNPDWTETQRVQGEERSQVSES